VTDAFAATTVVAGAGSVDLWITSTSADTDLEATISEVRADGTEIYVQSGWLRASQRALAPSATALRPAHTNLESDAADLPAGELTPVRIELFPFAHPFRAGSRLRLTIDAPGGNRPVWQFDTIDNGETVTIAYDAQHPSKLVLPVVPGVDVPAAAPPACGSLRGEPCRPWVKAANGG
jgi:predicted acyl esterase